MLAEQKKLLADLQSVEAAARKLLDKGVKIAGVVQKTRDAVQELSTRVRSLEESQPKAVEKKKEVKLPPPPPTE